MKIYGKKESMIFCEKAHIVSDNKGEECKPRKQKFKFYRVITVLVANQLDVRKPACGLWEEVIAQMLRDAYDGNLGHPQGQPVGLGHFGPRGGARGHYRCFPSTQFSEASTPSEHAWVPLETIRRGRA